MKKAYQWTIALILLGFLLVGIFLTLAPDQIPVHYNIRGEVDRWGSKYEYLIMPFINLIFGIFMVWLARNEGKKGRDTNEKIVAIMNNFVLMMFNGMWLLFMWKGLDLKNLSGGWGDLSGRLIVMLLAASLIPMGNIMPKVQRNSAFGLRTKWSMANDYCWQRSQRVGGYLMVGTGFFGVILTAILPVEWGGYAFLVLLIAMTIACTYASYHIYMRSQVQ